MREHRKAQDDPQVLGDWLRGRDSAAIASPSPPPVGPLLDDSIDLGPERPRRRLLVLVALPWALALTLGAVLLSGPPVAHDPSPVPAPSPVVAPVPAPTATPLASGPGEVGALLVRAALSAPAQGGADARYVDDVVVASVEQVGDVAVVGVLTVVLQGGQRPTLERYGIAVRGETRVAGPWLLPPALSMTGPPAAALDDPVLRDAAAATLSAAGYGDVAGMELLRDPALPGVLQARFQAIAPGAAAPADHTALLHDAPEPTVLGAGTHPPAADL